MPCVLHVAARAVAQHALSIFGDHQVGAVLVALGMPNSLSGLVAAACSRRMHMQGQGMFRPSLCHRGYHIWCPHAWLPQDAMAVRQTGWSMISSNSVQVRDLGAVGQAKNGGCKCRQVQGHRPNKCCLGAV